MSSSEGRVKEVIVDSRINKVLSMRTDSAAMVEAFDAISTFFNDNTIDSRRSLRQDLELQNITIAKKFLLELENIYHQVEKIEASSTKLQEACKSLATKVSTADENMKTFMKRANELNSNRIYLLKQSDEISKFLNHFQLSPQEVTALYSASLDNSVSSQEFFNAFQRLKTAYSDCKTMVESSTYSAGFELLDALGQHQDTAYRRLFEWTKEKCESLANDNSSQDIDFKLQYAIRCLRTLPMYFSQCQDLVVASRRGQLVQKFVIALTQGGASGQAFRAIDLLCHDPVRYIGDMLAWMHQTVVSEEEFLDAIFGDGSSGNQSDKTRPTGQLESNSGSQDTVSSPTEVKSTQLMGLSVQEMLVRCLQGLGRPLRTRINQTLESRTSILSHSGNVEILYSLTDLLAFYERTLATLIPLENAVHSAVKGSLGECQRSFLFLLNKQAELLVQSTPSTILDLMPSQVTKDCCNQIKEVLRVHSAAMSSIPSDATSGCYVDAVLGSIIQPLLQGCRLAGQTLGQADMAIFMLNNVSAIKMEVADGVQRLFSTSPDKKTISQWLELLATESDAWLDVIVADEAGKVLRRSDMDKLLELLEVLPEGLVASEQAGLGRDRVETVMRAFYASLLTSVTPLFDRLQDLDQKEFARYRTAKTIADAHGKVHRLVSNPFHRYDSSILVHTEDEVRVLLQLEES